MRRAAAILHARIVSRSLSSAFGLNVVCRTVTKGLVVPGKDRNENKIDGIVAIVMCVSRALVAPPTGGIMEWLKDAVTV